MIQIIAKLRLYNISNARKTPFATNYRPMFNTIPNMKTSGNIILIDRELFYPGDEGIVKIYFLNKKLIHDIVFIGAEITFGEGPIVVGEAEVLAIETL